MTNLCKEFDDFMTENDERFKELSKENQFYINAIGYGVKYYDLYRRIEKAIEYLEKRTARYHFTVFEFDELLDILKGSDSNVEE